jgi:hypothetical protein
LSDPCRIGRRKRKRRVSHGNQSESHGNQPGSHGNEPGSHGNPSGSHGGQVSEESAPEEDPVIVVAEGRMEPSEGWWNDYGFDSFGEYLKASRRESEKVVALFSRRKRSAAPAAKLPGGGALPAKPSRGGRNRQVSIRLDDTGFDALQRAARIYGVAPSTMARLLVQKGAQQALDEN